MTEDLVSKYELGGYGPMLWDSSSGEPIMWGHPIVHRLGDERFNELRHDVTKNGYSLECVYPNWYVITKKLTREDAIQKYGKITNEEFGPRGGWKSVTFGEKRFSSKVMKEEVAYK